MASARKWRKLRSVKIMLGFFKRSSEGKSTKARDPVCGMTIDLEQTKFKSELQGKIYGFCSQGCKESFDTNPSLYI